MKGDVEKGRDLCRKTSELTVILKESWMGWDVVSGSRESHAKINSNDVSTMFPWGAPKW